MQRTGKLLNTPGRARTQRTAGKTSRTKLPLWARAPDDNVALKDALIPTAETLPATAAARRASSDTVRRLLLNGFYDRRKSSGAPMSAFVTSDMIAKWGVRSLADITGRNGRG